MYGEQMVRMLRAVDLLSTPAGATKQELAGHLGVDKRTVERLLGLLQELNFPVYDEQDSLSGKFTKDYTGKEKIIDGLRRGMFEQKRCAVEYHSFLSGKMRDYDLDPLKFFENNGGLYVFAHITAYDEIRTLAVERIKRLEVTDTSFDYPEDFDPEKLLCSAFGIIFDKPILAKIRFSEEVAPYIRERTWAPNQRITESEVDGSLILEMETCGWLDVKKWVLSYGMDAEVLEPGEMRKEIVEELSNCLGQYASAQVSS